MNRNLLLLFAAILVGLSVQAATYYGFKIGGVAVNSDNCNNVTGNTISGTVKYDLSSNTVTLTNVTISRTGNDNRAIFNESNSGLIVKLVGTNKLSATDAAPVRFQKTTTLTIASGTTTITGGSEGGIYISGAYKLTINGPGTLNVTATSKGGIEGSDAANTVEFNNVTASIYGGGSDLLNIYSVTFKTSSHVTLKSINSNVQNVKNVDLMLFEGKEVIQTPSNARFYEYGKSIAYYNYSTNSFGNIVCGTDILISDRNVGAVFNNTYFPDEKFRNYFTNKYQKGFVTTQEIAECTTIDVISKGISSIQGIEYFTELTTLNFQRNNVTTADLSHNTKLQNLQCPYNQLTSLNLSNNPLIYLLHCENNNLTSLNVQNCTQLEQLYCQENKLTRLDLENNTHLYWIVCYHNKIDIYNGNFLVSGLPANTSEITQEIYFRSDSDENMLTTSQVQNANDKGWVLKCSDGNDWKEYYGVVHIGSTSFTDANFRSYVSINYDTNSDGYLDQDEWEVVTTMSVDSMGITDLKGIEYFRKLKILNCFNNQLTTLNMLKNNTELTSLNCGYNQLTSLDMSQNTMLTSLHCPNNRLASLDVHGCTALKELECQRNQLTALYLSDNTNLEKLVAYSNLISNQLSLENHTKLYNLHMYINKLNKTKMTYFIEHLPTVLPARYYLWIYDDAAEDGYTEGNYRPDNDLVVMANHKGWILREWNEAQGQWVDITNNPEPIVGDVTGDSIIDVEDVNAAINIILKKKTVDDYPGNADVTGEGVIDVEDVNAIINIILHK
ncbi:MAG: hypothetical protein J6S96_04155 [Muribaculaceae bacterium]|nr:hypothetical protein [Muribaculaceae bacterium]